MPKKIFIISPEFWGDSFVSKHHYAEILSADNDVYFFNPPKGKIEKNKVHDGLTVINYKLPRGLNKLPKKLRYWLQGRIAQQLIKKLKLPVPHIIWSFDPYVFQNLGAFDNNALKIYHPVDEFVTPLENDIAQQADIIFSTSTLILERLKAPKAFKQFINHGLAKHFIDDIRHNDFDYIKDEQGPKVGYVGNLLYQYLDQETLLKIIEHHPKITFYFVGPYKASNLSANPKRFLERVDKLKAYANVRLLGPVPTTHLPSFLRQMDMFLMCYKGDSNPKEMANPHKILEYLSTGKPIVTHYIYEYRAHKDKILMANTADEVFKNFNSLVKGGQPYQQSKEAAEARRKFALENSYQNQVEKISKIILDHMK